MDVVIRGIVASYVLKRVPRERVPTVIVDRFDSGTNEEQEALSCGKIGTLIA